MKLAPSLAFHFDFLFAFQQFVLTKDLEACDIDHKMNPPRWPDYGLP